MALERQHMDDCGRELTEPIDAAMWLWSDATTLLTTKVHSRMLA